jgi:hypothetical protein
MTWIIIVVFPFVLIEYRDEVRVFGMARMLTLH